MRQSNTKLVLLSWTNISTHTHTTKVIIKSSRKWLAVMVNGEWRRQEQKCIRSQSFDGHTAIIVSKISSTFDVVIVHYTRYTWSRCVVFSKKSKSKNVKSERSRENTFPCGSSSGWVRSKNARSDVCIAYVCVCVCRRCRRRCTSNYHSPQCVRTGRHSSTRTHSFLLLVRSLRCKNFALVYTEIGPTGPYSLSLNCILYLNCSVRINYRTLISVASVPWAKMSDSPGSHTFRVRITRIA